MNMQVNPSGRLQQETALKAAEVKQPEQAAASAAGTASSAKAVLETRAGQVAGTAETVKAAACPKGGAGRLSCDQYIPQKAEEPASYGHYQPVSDGEGNTHIQFDAPPAEAAAGQDGQVSASVKTAETAAGKQPVHDRYVVEKQSGKEKASASGSKQNAQVLELRKKRLEQQVRSAGDSEERKALKQKLEQVKRALKAAGKK